MKLTYLDAMHAMQTGVGLKMLRDPGETSPKHLRVGVNSALVETSAIAKLLVAKGIFTMEEFQESLTEMINLEVEAYEEYFKNKGMDVKLY